MTETLETIPVQIERGEAVLGALFSLNYQLGDTGGVRIEVLGQGSTAFISLPALRVLGKGGLMPLFGCGYHHAKDPYYSKSRAAVDLLCQIARAGCADGGSQLVLVEKGTLKPKARIVISPHP